MRNSKKKNGVCICEIVFLYIITAGNLEAVQVRISNIVKEIDKTENLNVNRAYICVKNDKIEIEKW